MSGGWGVCVLEDYVLFGEFIAVPGDNHDLPLTLIQLPLVLLPLDHLLDDGWLG